MEKRLTTEIENLTLHINGIDKCITETLNNLDTKQMKFEEFNQERSSFTYLKKTEQIGWRTTIYIITQKKTYRK